MLCWRIIIKCNFVCFRDGQPYMYPNTIVLTNICSQIGKNKIGRAHV